MKIRLALALGASALSVSACAAAAYGSGVDYAYGDSFNCYNGYNYDPYYNVGNCGWYNGFFYPGFGAFVFDHDHHRHRMNGDQRNHYTRQARGPDGGRRVGLGSSGGAAPHSIDRPESPPRNGMHGFGGFAGVGGGRPSNGFQGHRGHG